MITAINNTNQNYAVNFERRRKGINTKKIKKAWKELPYTLGIKKKKTIWEKIGDFFAPKKKSPMKSLKKNSKLGVDEIVQPKRDNLFEFMAKDMGKRIKKWDEVFFDTNV